MRNLQHDIRKSLSQASALPCQHEYNYQYDEKCPQKDNAQAEKIYNTALPHMSINMITTLEAFSHIGEIKKGWTCSRDITIKICRQKAFFQIISHLREHKLPYKVSVTTLLICHFLLVIGNYRNKTKKPTDFRFNVKTVNFLG